jgi:uncharacterized protein with HEPN domain
VITCTRAKAIKRIPDEVRAAHPEIDWQGFARLRDVIAHGYFKLNLDLVWHAAQVSVPRLAEQVAKLTESMGPE